MTSTGKFRFSLAKLLGAVVVVAVGLGVLVNATEWWGNLAFSFTLVALGSALGGVVYRRNGARAFWLGFLVFGGGYTFLVAVGVTQPLVTSNVLAFLHQRVRRFQPPWSTESVLTVRLRSDGVVLLNQQRVDLEQIPMKIGDTPNNRVYAYEDPECVEPDFDPGIRSSFYRTLAQIGGYRQSGNPQFFPLAADFNVVGHALFALSAAVLGGLIVRYFYVTRERTT